MTCCSTLARRTTLKILNTEERLLTLSEAVKMSTSARVTMTRSSLFLHHNNNNHVTSTIIIMIITIMIIINNDTNNVIIVIIMFHAFQQRLGACDDSLCHPCRPILSASCSIPKT